MKKEYITLFAWIFSFCSISAVNAQTTNVTSADSIKTDSSFTKGIVDYGLRKDKAWRNTGAVYTLNGEDLTHMTQANLLNTLQGRIPGLTVVTGSGEPGYDSPTLYVRGESSWNITGNQVLIYLDGFQVDMTSISGLSTHEIESVTLLKDAAAVAMYGLQGGAGVLSIRTKRGNVGTTVITGDARYGIMSAIDLPTVANAYDYVTGYNTALQNDGLPIKYPNPELYKAANDPYHPNVNWYNELLKNTSAIQDYNFSFRGGNNTAKYFVLMNYTNFEGLYKDADAIDKDFGTNAKYQKLNLRANVDLKLNKNLTLSSNISGITEDRYTPAGFTSASVFNALLQIPASSFPVKNPNGSWGNNSVYSFNPVELLQQGGIYSSHTRTLEANIGFVQKLDKLVKGLDFKGELAFSNQYVGTDPHTFTVPSYEITKDANDQPSLDANGNIIYKQIGVIGQGGGEGGGNFYNRVNTRLGFDYDRSFGKSTFTGLLLATRQDFNYAGAVYDQRVQGLSANVTYDYSQTYIASLSAGYNGSADFAPGHRYGFFPSIGLGWITSNEDFLKDNPILTYLKVRGSYGTSGNINQNYRFLYQQFASQQGGWITGTNNSYQTGYNTGAFANTDFSWEKKTTLDLGVDFKLFKTLSGTVDVFQEKRTGILELPTATIPAYSGIILQDANTGKAQNKGFEIALNYDNKGGAFEYYLGGSMAYARNKITAQSENSEPYSYLYNTGYSIDQTRGLISNGFYQTSDFDADGNLKAGVVKSSYGPVKPGDIKYVDEDGNGIINAFDVKPIKYGNVPEITLGFNFGFKYKGFDFDAYLQGVMNRTVNLLTQAGPYVQPFVNGNNLTPFSSNPWTPATATTATSPELTTLYNANNSQTSDFWLRNGNFLKVRSLELGYTLPQVGFLKKMDAVRVFVNGTNLFTWDKIKDLEAEDLSMGYPLTKVVSFGLKVKL